MAKIISTAEYKPLRDQLARPVKVSGSPDSRGVAERKKIFIDLLYEFGGLYVALERGRIDKGFVVQQLELDKAFSEQVEIGLKRGIEKGLIHAVRIIDDLNVAPSQKGATANLLRAIREAARDLYPWLFPEEETVLQQDNRSIHIYVGDKETGKLLEQLTSRKGLNGGTG